MIDIPVEVTPENFSTLVPGLEIQDTPEHVVSQIDAFLEEAVAKLESDINNQGYAQVIVPLNGGMHLSELTVQKLFQKNINYINNVVIIPASKEPALEAIKYDLRKIGLSDEVTIGEWSQWSATIGHDIKQLACEQMIAYGYSPEAVAELLTKSNAHPGKYYLGKPMQVIEGSLINVAVKPGIARMIDDIMDTESAKNGIKAAIREANPNTEVRIMPCSRKENTPKPEDFTNTIAVHSWITAGYFMNGGVAERSKDGKLANIINAVERFSKYIIHKKDDFNENQFHTEEVLNNYLNFLLANSLIPNLTESAQYKVHVAFEQADRAVSRLEIAKGRITTWFKEARAA